MAANSVVQVLELIGRADWKTAVVLLFAFLLVLVWPWLRAHVRAGSVLVWDRKLRRTCIPADKRRSLVTEAAERYMLPLDKSAAPDRGQEGGKPAPTVVPPTLRLPRRTRPARIR